jgi:hypothetical protein
MHIQMKKIIIAISGPSTSGATIEFFFDDSDLELSIAFVQFWIYAVDKHKNSN